MQNKQLTISSSNITRCFLLFIVLLTIGIGLYGYNYTNARLAEKKYTLNSIAGSLQKRIDTYRYMTYRSMTNSAMRRHRTAIPVCRKPACGPTSIMSKSRTRKPTR